MVLVTDRPQEAESVAAVLRQAAIGRDVRILSNQEEALALIEQEKKEVVFSFFSCGALASTLFLNEVWKRNPKGSRFLLDSFADPGTLIRCVLGGHQYLQIPLDAAAFSAALERADAIKNYVRNDRIQSLVSRLRTLPTKPSLYLELMREVRSPGASATSVGELVAKDLSVSTKLIQLANTPYFGAGQSVTDVKDAVMLLGLETTVSVVLSIEAFAKFDKVKPIYFSVDKVWKHSQQVADLSKRICRELRQNQDFSAQCFLAALLHDIGKLAFAENFGDEYHSAVKTAEEQGRLLFDVELDVFRATHSDTGAYLLALWGLPLSIVDAVANHHCSPGMFGNQLSPAATVHLAEQLAGNPEPTEEILQKYPPELGLREHLEAFEQLVPTSVKELRKTAAKKLEATQAATAKPLSPEPAAPVSETQSPTAPAQQKGRMAKLFGGMGRFFDKN